MASSKQIIANRKNALRSTGPRSLLGKQRSRNNAKRHGLASRTSNDPNIEAEIVELTQMLSSDSRECIDTHIARQIAESYFDLHRIREVKSSVLEIPSGSIDVETSKMIVDRMRKISRYEKRAMSKRRRIFATEKRQNEANLE